MPTIPLVQLQTTGQMATNMQAKAPLKIDQTNDPF